MADEKKRIIDLAELSQKVQEGQYILVDSADGTGKMNLKKIADDSKEGLANEDGYYPDLYAGNLSSTRKYTDSVPYLFRKTAGGASKIGEREDNTLVGASVGENQLMPISTIRDVTGNNGVRVTNNGDGSFTLNGTASDLNFNVWLIGSYTDNVPVMTLPKGHVFAMFYINAGFGTSDNTGTITLANATFKRILAYNKYLVKVSDADYKSRGINFIQSNTGDVFDNTMVYPQIIDLTAKFGSAIADYIYNLETATAGAGVAKLREWGFLTEDYYEYNPGSLESVQATAHVMRDADDNIIGNYDLGTDTLRGLFKLDAENRLYADGDTKTSDGVIARKYGIRAYQSGDESLADAITDGTNTVYKLATPTTEQSTPFTNPQICDPDGTEEYATSNGVPVGHETEYDYDIKGLAEELIDVPDVPSTNGTYVLKATRTASGLSYNWVTG